jgi:catechol 2,3-dioxygenase-like lactoylglutathione lyase family enzyme
MTTPESASPEVAVSFLATIPILRSFDEQKAREFYLDFLDFKIVFEHRFAPDLPLYMEVARGSLRLHISGHHGDATPGSTVFIPMTGVQALHRELAAKHYGHARPGIEHAPWGDVLEVADPFGNRLRFCQMK